MTEKKSALDYLKTVGPALIVSAVVVGPGSVTTASSMGASYGYIGLWLVVFSCIVSYFFQEAAVRVVVYKEESILSAVRNELAPGVSKVVFILSYIMTLLAQAGNFTGAGMAMNYFLPQLSVVQWSSLLVVLALIIVFLKKDGLLDNLTKTLVFMMVVAFIITAFASKPDVGRMVSEGFSFQIPGGQWMLALALVGTTIVADTPLALSTLNKEKYCGTSSELAGLSREEKAKRGRIDLVISLVVTGAITCSILICSATVLNPLGVTVSTAADMAIQLTPLLGTYAGVLFSLGLWAAAFSSGAYRMKLMPLYYADAWAVKEDEHITTKKLISLFAGLIPLAILMIWGSNPVQLVIVVQTSVGLLLPIVTIIMGVLLNKKAYLEEHCNNIVQNIAFLIMALVTTAMAVRTFVNLF